MIKKAFVTASILCLGFSVSTLSHAHNFWLSVSKHNPDGGEKVSVTPLIGHADKTLLWPFNPHRIIGLNSMGPQGTVDHQDSMLLYPVSKSLPVTYDAEGVYIFSIETTSSFSELPSDKFRDYIKEEGLTPIILHRADVQKNKAGREIYSRRGKAIINAGDVENVSPDYLFRPIGHTLEFVPLSNYSFNSKDEPITADVYYRGVKTEGITVRLISLSEGADVEETVISNSQGRVSFPRPDNGKWKLHAVWSDVLENDEDAEYDTIFASLSFEVREN